ncbi:MAG TPA: hypothetical protein VGN70_01430 [Gammaproteobacteria bacterium]
MDSVKRLVREKQEDIRTKIMWGDYGGKLEAQAVLFQQRFGDLASPDNRTRKNDRAKISGSMRQERFRLIMVFLTILYDSGYHPKYLWNLGPEHYERVVTYLVTHGMKPGNLRKHIAAFRCLYGWMDKSKALKTNEELLPKHYHRQPTHAQRDPTWSGNGIHLPAVLTQLEGQPLWVPAALELIGAFGLRRAESLLIDLHLADRGFYLVIYIGSKGGRWRCAPIDEPRKRALLDRLKGIFPAGQALIGSLHEISKDSAKQKFSRVLREVVGISKEESGCTSHGLRAEYLCILYEKLTGEKAPIQGGAPVAPRRDRAARAILARVSGHTRRHISRYYIGKVLPGWRGTTEDANRPLSISQTLGFLLKHEAKVLERLRPEITAALEARKASRSKPSYASQHGRTEMRRRRRSAPRLPAKSEAFQTK